jgi:signal transduction histidine kinase
VSEARPLRAAGDALVEQVAFHEALLEALASIATLTEEAEILERTRSEAARLFSAREARLLDAADSPAAPEIREGTLVVPLVALGRRAGAVVLERPAGFTPADLAKVRVLADFAARGVEHARLLEEAQEREAERARLAEQLITAEQDERRRLSIFLHDGPLSQMSGIALLHDAALAAIAEGRHDDAAKVIRTSLERERATIRELRDLTFAIEPLVLRDHGFAAAVEALGDQVARAEQIAVLVDARAGERLGEKAQVALYQVVREALALAVRRKPSAIELRVRELEDGSYEAELRDDGMGERRRAAVEAIEERVRIVNGRLFVDNLEEGGTRFSVLLPAYVAAASDPQAQA